MRKIVLAFLAFLMVFGSGFNYAFAARISDPAAPEAWANDTIAGFSTSIKTSRTFPNKNFLITVERPDSTKLILQAETDANGYAEIELDNLHTKKAGIYSLTVGVSDKTNTFKVYPDQVSSSESDVLVDKQTLKPSRDYATLNVVLTDKFNNPIANHQVNVISSRPGDKIEALTGRDYTDANGSVMFKISADTSGISTYSVYDATNKTVLDKRISVLYTGNTIGNVGGNEYLFANSFGPELLAVAAGPAAKFEFGEIPEEINTNSVISFSLSALDSQDNVVSNYLGAVHFSAIGGGITDVVLPDDYKFTATDMGKHTFAKALTFKKAGTYKLQVNDLDDPTLQGETTVIVKTSGANQTQSSLISITNPVPGKYSANAQSVSGTSLPGSDVKIFDNNEEIGTASANSTGAFSFTTPPLADGVHILYAAAVNDKGVVLGISNKVTVEIDTTPAAIDSITLMPDKDISMGSPVMITVVTEPNMTRVSVVIDGNITDLESVEGMPGTYRGSFQAPTKSGNYGIDVVLTDNLNNEKTYEKQKSFNVTETSSIRPSDVIGLRAFAGNEKVTLTWNPATDARGIAYYTVYFGSDPKSMVNAVNTLDSSTTWYVPNLKNETTYYFAVKAVNKDGNDSAKASAVVVSRPSEDAGPAPFGVAPDEESILEDVYFEDEYEEGEETAETGPAAIVVFGISGLAAAASFIFRKRIRK